MESNRPSSRPDIHQQKTLAAALGDLRDAVGAVRNLAQLLGNVRVGPRAVTAVVPDGRTTRASIEGAVRMVLDNVAPHLADPTPTEQLWGWVVPRASELEQELLQAREKPINAKQRLHMEQALRRLSRELDAARALLELLDSAVRGSWVRVGVSELLREATATREQRPSAGMEVRVGKQLEGDALLNPRVALALLGIGARLVGQDKRGTPAVTAHGSGAEGLSLEIGLDGEGTTSSVILAVPPLIEPSLACALAAAQAAGTDLSYAPDAHRFVLKFGG